MFYGRFRGSQKKNQEKLQEGLREPQGILEDLMGCFTGSYGESEALQRF